MWVCFNGDTSKGVVPDKARSAAEPEPAPDPIRGTGLRRRSFPSWTPARRPGQQVVLYRPNAHMRLPSLEGEEESFRAKRLSLPS